ncbi:MAG: CHAT domain-containing protein [Blastocatellia bacterium]
MHKAQLLDPDLRALFNGSRHHYYDDYVELLMRLRAAEQAEEFAATAFYASERTHARTLLGLLSERALGLLDSSETSLAARARELEQQIAARTDNEAQPPGGELALLMAEYNEVRAQIRQRNPHYAALIQSEPLTLAEVQRQVLNADTLLLEYYLGVKHSYLFVVSPTALHSFVLPPRAELEQAAHELRALLDAFSHPPAFHSIPVKQRWQQEQTRAQQDAATRLGHLLLAPAQALLRGQRLLIVPDGALHVVPFAALPVAARPLPVVSDHAKRNKSRTTNNRQLTTDNQQPLLARHEIITLPSASTLAVLRREALHRQPAPKTLAVFADPVFDQQDERVRTVVERQNAPQLTLPRYDESAITRQGLVRLPATRNEAQAIAALVPPAERRLALGFDASRAAALGAALHPYRYVHFATHGLLNNAQPELSGLVLSQVDAAGHTQNGLLRTLDIFNLKLNADLVVLSGCQTALGREVNGEGLIGMTRGFLYAGARRVIASLWQVNDAATAELMRRFYQGLWGEQKLAPAAALRAAQLQLRCNQRWQSPYYWAAFTLQGEW